MTLTESFAMLPTAAVSGFYLSHPDAQYFAVGRIGQDQLDGLRAPGGVGVDEARRRLRAQSSADEEANDARWSAVDPHSGVASLAAADQTLRSVVDEMTAQGWVDEGARMCVPPNG